MRWMSDMDCVLFRVLHNNIMFCSGGGGGGGVAGDYGKWGFKERLPLMIPMYSVRTGYHSISLHMWIHANHLNQYI